MSDSYALTTDDTAPKYRTITTQSGGDGLLNKLEDGAEQAGQNIQNNVNAAIKDPGRYGADAIGVGPDTPFGKQLAQTNPDGTRSIFGGQNSIYNQAWNLVTSAHQQDAATPDTPAPTLDDATTTSTKQQLVSEGQQRTASSILTSGQGLLDQPTTSSRVLVGD